MSDAPGKRRILRILLILVLAVGGFEVVGTLNAPQVQAADASQWQPGNIISDAQFFDYGSMSLTEIEAFLDLRGKSCVAGAMACLKDYTTSTWSTPAEQGLCDAIPATSASTAGQVIYQVARACRISPKVLIVTLQKEQGLITRSQPTAEQYKKAMGYGCPDTAPCDAQYFGFFNQVYQAARRFQWYTTHPTSFNYQKGRYNNILYNPNSACGTGSVYIENQATANLYIYTPYQPNAAALNNLYGSGDGCSAYGNRNFWAYFVDWFGSPAAKGTPALTNTGGVPLYIEASGGSTRLATLPSAVQLEAFGPENNGFVRVRFGSVMGYVDKRWVAMNPPAVQTLVMTTSGIPVYYGPGSAYLQAGNLNEGAVVTASAELVDGYVHISFGSFGGWVEQRWVSTAPGSTPHISRSVYTNTGAVPVYVSNSASSATLAKVPTAGTELGASAGSSSGFIAVKYGSEFGWVEARWLSFNPVATGAAKTNTNGVAVYLGPGAQYEPAGTLGAEQVVQTGESSGEYTRIVFGATGGWVQAKWLSVNPVPSSSAMTNTNGIPVLLGPGAGFASAGSVGAGQVLQTAESKDGFVRVVFGSYGGWIQAKWLSVNPVPSSSAMTNTNGIPVLLGPGAGFASAGSVGAGQVLQTAESKDGFVRVVFGSYGGWVQAKWLSVNPTGSGVRYTITNGVPLTLGPGSGYARVAEYPTNTGVWIAGQQDGFTQIVFGQYGAWIPTKWLASTSSGPPPAATYGKTNTGGVPILSAPSSGAAVMGAHVAGAVVPIGVSMIDGYRQVSYGGQSAWIKGDWLTTAPVVAGTRTTITSGVPVHLGPGTAYSYVTQLPVGTTVRISTETVNGWTHIDFGAYGAWVQAKWLG